MGENRNGTGIGVGLALGMALGVVIWMLTDNVAFIGAGLAIGLGLGVAVDSWPSKDHPRSRPPEDEDRDGGPTG